MVSSSKASGIRTKFVEEREPVPKRDVFTEGEKICLIIGSQDLTSSIDEVGSVPNFLVLPVFVSVKANTPKD